MKNIFRICLLCILCLPVVSAIARSGVYVTYQDFKNGNLQKADDKTFSFNLYKKNITMKVNGEKKKFEASETWGYLMNDELYRVIPGPRKMFIPSKLISAGAFYTWFYTEQYNTTSSTSTNFISGPNTKTTTTTTHNLDLTFVSYGINGEPYQMANKKLLEAAAASQPKFKPILDCANSKKTNMRNPYLYNVTECLSDQPGNITDLKSVIPPDKN